MITFFKKLFRRIPLVPHVCKYACTGYASHYSQVFELLRTFEHPDWHHFPEPQTVRGWLRQGFDHAEIYQSHWACSCGKHKTFFFLANPCVYTPNQKSIKQISKEVFAQMTQRHPMELGAAPGSTLDEAVKEICADLGLG